MPIQFSSYTNQTQAVLSTEPFLNISRAVTRLKDIYISFYGPPVGVGTDEDAQTNKYQSSESIQEACKLFEASYGRKRWYRTTAYNWKQNIS